MVVPLRSQARLWHSLLHWAYSALFRAQRARFVRPSPSLARCSVPAHFVCSALQPFGPSPFCKHLLPKNTRNDVHAVISDLSLVLPILCQCSDGRASSPATTILNSQWSSCIFAPPCADACAVFRGCALRFAPCARHSSPSGLRCSQSSLVALPASLGSSHRPALTLARCSVAAHCASLRVLATPALRASDARRARLWHSLLHWGLRTGLRFAGPVFRGCGALRAVPQFAMVVLLRLTACSSPLLIGLTSACFAHCARPPCAPRPFTPSGLRRLRPVSATGSGLRAPQKRLCQREQRKAPGRNLRFQFQRRSTLYEARLRATGLHPLVGAAQPHAAASRILKQVP